MEITKHKVSIIFIVSLVKPVIHMDLPFLGWGCIAPFVSVLLNKRFLMRDNQVYKTRYNR